MPVLTCNACNKEFQDEVEQKLHYRSEWHRYNLKRKVAGVPGVTEALFQARQSALAEERNQLSATAMLYGCALCGKEYRSSKAHDQHLKSRAHAMKASQESDPAIAGITIIKPITGRMPNKSALPSQSSTVREMDDEESEESDDEWVEVDPDDELEMASESLTNLHVNEQNSGSGADQSDGMDEVEDLDPSCCFICDQKHHGIESCMVHMHKLHGFFIPDVEYLKDPKGLLTYVGLKVRRDFMCLYCNERCHPFQSLEAVRKHMIAKGHCKLRYGDGGDDDDGDLEDFYDYSSSYLDADGKQLVAATDMANSIELGTGGSELIVRQRTDGGVLVRTLGSREYLRYYRQKPRPSPARDIALAISLASRYRILGLATVQSKERIVRMKVLREMNRNGVEGMRSKIGMKSNVIRNLPNNVPY
ncbi:cytoplasmic 60S subunit biogenesis factor REI1 homolog 1-like [Phoenix dactylifera]|uniref:Cytoplasmic 60S subunit biogenesis factor REI1 homolog 1-like n=1 Tax=Phoenix dactylifera TaxID=42345 RepID=A0A8B7BHI9_PHODC|nr:cytoplasmic 60S subunit biogenesis factor REI1 homolog 1-like [Phoenix dactylifera]